ncbi:MAG: DUF1512 domain-containing protein [Nitrososphaerota archaeon]|nr:DUF1512 domain-containing protein [Nitrososphaerota archaeon]MDG6967687.1 DUF1512 domain-containing protein [Nitrososphaerota archaeon]MDG6978172.1 DUF1512 domain-containing protein [Nitrososphaerota archaeon]MDG7021030.1 DUF1512 domain-containing protein [Nitrososphaerota archaeon]MDG7022376.1 DUF1512 domain-containing protein [Nitrososphaerota archaeon]
MTSPLPGIGLNNILTIAYYLFFFVFVFYGGRVQSFFWLNSIGRSLGRLESMKTKARDGVVAYFKSKGAPSNVGERVDRLVDYVTIMPVDLDPKGIVQKIGHIAETSDERARGEIRGMLAGADAVSASIAQNLLELATGLNMIHKVVRHYYLVGKKGNGMMTIMQLQMSLPHIMQQAKAMSSAMDSLQTGTPIGDGVGPLVASRLLAGAPTQVVAKDTVVGTTVFEGRTLYVMKAEGPMGYVGQPGVAMQRVVEEMKVPLKAIVMVDAAAKLEGEGTGDVAEGVGAAIGGLGVEKFEIEEVATKHDIPVYAVLVKQGDLDVMATMNKEIADGADRAVELVKRIVRDRTNEGESVLVAGIGNTLGVGQ